MGGGRGGSRRALARSAPDGLGPLAYFSTFLRPATILTDMLVVRADGFVDRCIPSLAHKPPSGPDWVHEVKHDGYRLIVRRDGETVRLFTRRGYDWTGRYPAIATPSCRYSSILSCSTALATRYRRSHSICRPCRAC
jgi:hypothetical protein